VQNGGYHSKCVLVSSGFIWLIVGPLMGFLATRFPFHIRRGGFTDDVGGCLLLKKDFTTGSFVLSNHFKRFSLQTYQCQ